MLVGANAPVVRTTSLVSAVQSAAQSPVAEDGVVLVDRDERDLFHPWSVIADRAERVAAAFVSAGVRPGDRVAIILPTSRGFLDAFFGALFAGAIAVPLYPPVRLGRLREYEDATRTMLAKVTPRALVVDRRIRSILGGVLSAAELAQTRAFDVEALATGAERHAASPREDAIALIQFSSGSTVDPKAVALTHGQILAQCAALDALVRDRPENTRVGCSWLPLYHDMGLIGCLLLAAYYPGRIVLLAPEHFLAKPAAWLRAISRHRAFISAAPNFAYGVCAKRIRDADLAGVDLSSWRMALNGAEPIVARTLDAFVGRFRAVGFDRAALMPVYGLAEAALAVTAPEVGRGPRVTDGLVSVGVPVPGFSVRIVDGDGREKPDGAEGVIEARGPSIMHGYFADAAATERALHDGWLDTGDLGLVRDGALFVTGRAKDLVIVRGENHMPQEFENALHDVSGVRTGCVVALGETFPDGEGLLILAERAAGTTRPDVAIAADIAAEILAQTQVRPAHIALLAPGTLPRTSSGKLRRRAALQAFRSGALRPPQRVNTWTMLRALIRSRFLTLRAP